MRAPRLFCRRRLFVAAVAVAVVCAVGMSACWRSAAPPAKRRVLLLALDAATWDLLTPWIEQGLLPNLASLSNSGAAGPLKSISPSSSPVIWTSVATGKVPAKHGITNFVRLGKDPGHPRPVDSSMRKGKALWNILGERGLDVAVVGWFVTWPAEEVNGRMLTDRAHYGGVARRAFPPGYLPLLTAPDQAVAVAAMPRFMNFKYDPSKLRRGSDDPEEQINFLVFDRFVRAWTRDVFYLEGAKAMLEDGPLPDFMALYLRGTDDVQHGFWKFMQPGLFGDSVSEQQVRDFGKAIERYWQWIDEELGKILAYYDEDTLVMVVSDHGAGPAVGEYKIRVPEYLHLSGAHRDVGVMMLSGAGARRGYHIEGASVYDVAPTLLHYFGLPIGEDMDGKVLLEAFEPGAVAARVTVIPSWEPSREESSDASGSGGENRDAATAFPPAASEEVLRHLRSLGYID